MQQVNILRDLISNYAVIFRVSVREMHAKSKMDLLQSKTNTTKVRLFLKICVKFLYAEIEWKFLSSFVLITIYRP